ncbi:hypothetical protein [Roseomonas sp. HF4]|uniref:hypothetical protein n=1 Tax=Roseomonas sp. HF4 TaxID=2562313 RepID=UPI0010C12882|nr:hypothetical protein [Roseomonas sp. HF4]
MRRRAALVLLACAGSARAQDLPAELPPEPPPAPPPPPRLAPEGAPLAPSVPPDGPPLPPGMTALPGGALRVAGAPGRLDPAQSAALAAFGRALAALPAGRVAVEAQVSGPINDASMARRASLSAAQAVKAALVAGGLDPTRIDLRPLGRVGAGVDRVDVLPPGVASPAAEARGR